MVKSVAQKGGWKVKAMHNAQQDDLKANRVKTIEEVEKVV